LGIGTVLLIAYFGIRVTNALRPSSIKADTSQTDLARGFEEMQREGDINAHELRNIKAVLERNPPRS
jgi:hypothetical protein